MSLKLYQKILICAAVFSAVCLLLFSKTDKEKLEVNLHKYPGQYIAVFNGDNIEDALKKYNDPKYYLVIDSMNSAGVCFKIITVR